jgi:hypothetical protein
VRHAPIIVLHCFEPPSANPHIEPITAHSALTPDAFPSLPEAAAPRPVPRRSVRRCNAPKLFVYGPEHVTMRGRLGGVTLLSGSVPVVLCVCAFVAFNQVPDVWHGGHAGCDEGYEGDDCFDGPL